MIKTITASNENPDWIPHSGDYRFAGANTGLKKQFFVIQPASTSGPP